MRFLVVDLDRAAAAAVAAALEDRGHRTLSVADPREAYTLVHLADLDGVVIGMPMPDDRGWQLLSAVRASSRTRVLPVLMLSDGKERVRALLEGADDSLPKSVQPAELAARLERMVGLRVGSSGDLLGSLSKDGLAERLRGLEQERGSGVLRLIGEHRDGWIELERGQLVEARFGLLEGGQALLALLSVRHGRIAFEPHDAKGNADSAVAGALSLADLVSRLKQLEKSLGGFAALPRPETNLRVLGDLASHLAAPDGTPYSEVFQRIRALPGVTLEELLAHQIAPQVQVKLALATLIKSAAIETFEQPQP